MREKLRFLGLDVHAETIAVAIAEPNGEVRSLGTIGWTVTLPESRNFGSHALDSHSGDLA